MSDEPDIRLLGPVEVWHGADRVDLGGRRERLVLGLLALSVAEPVSASRLGEAVWSPRDPPPTARNAIQVSVSRLRAALGLLVPIVRVGDAYRLCVDAARIDLHRFRSAVITARALEDAARAASLQEADRLWRGPFLAAELTDEARSGPWAGVDEERVAAIEDRIETELRLGRHREAIVELTDLAAAHHTRERLVRLLMLALYRDDQGARALEVGRRTRARLAEDLGIDPGPGLRDLEVAILRHAPNLSVPPWPVVGGIPAQLPPVPAGLTGREGEVATLDALVARDGAAATLTLVTGTAGVGKTALAVCWAHTARPSFPDGQLYIDMHGYAQATPLRPFDALTRFLRALAVPTDRIPADETEAAALYRSVLADRRVLVLLDNVADADQVRPLLPAGPGCAVVVTSRDDQDGLVACDGARRLVLDVLAPEAAIRLLRAAVGARVDAEPAATTELAGLCGGLPLALRIAGAALADRPVRTIGDYAATMRFGDRLTELSVDDDPQTAVRAAFAPSYRGLREPERRTFRLVGLVPGADVTTEAVAALTGEPAGAAQRALTRLARAHLVDEQAPGRYAQHDLLRRYAKELAAADGAGPVAALMRWYLETTLDASRRLYPQMTRLPDDDRTETPAFATAEKAVGWLDAERANLVAAVEYGCGDPALRRVAWRIADALRGYFWHARHRTDWLRAARAGLDAAQGAGDARARAAMHVNLGGALQSLHRDAGALQAYRTADDLALAAGWVRGRCAALTGLGNLQLGVGDLDDAERAHRTVLLLKRQVDDTVGESVSTGNLAVVLMQAGRLCDAADQQTESLRLARRAGAALAEANALAFLGYTEHLRGDLATARRHLVRALWTYRQMGNRHGEAFALMDLAAVQGDGGRTTIAQATAEQALALVQATGERDSEAYARNVRGTLRLGRGRPMEAIADHDTALRLAVDTRSRYAQAEALIGRSAALCATGRPGEASDDAERALAIAERAGFRVLAGRALAAAAVAAAAVGDRHRAERAARRASALHRQTGHRPGELAALAMLARTHRDDGPAAYAGSRLA